MSWPKDKFLREEAIKKMANSKRGKRGKHHSEETKRKISVALKGKIKSEEHRKKLSISLKGKPGSNLGKHFSEEHRKRIGDALRGERCYNWKGGPLNEERRAHRRELKRVLQCKRRAIKKQADGSFSLDEWQKLKKQYGNICPVCGKPEPEIKLTIDHIIPLMRGGNNYIENIQPLCSLCNMKKYTKVFKTIPCGKYTEIYV